MTDTTPFAALSPHLRERTRYLTGSPARAQTSSSPQWVLYWMRTAMRGHDNPALDVAVCLANNRGIPVLVYQELRNDGPRPYPNDRHHSFVLQGARDVHRELSQRQIRYALHVERDDHPSSHLDALVDGAAAVVVEDLPVYWHRDETMQLTDHIEAPLLAVDTACIVPVKRIRGRHDRAYQFRAEHTPLLTSRIEHRWASIDPERPPLSTDELPFQPLDMEGLNVADLVARCEIDHSIAPVGDTPGGSKAAYPRWRAFRDEALAHYHQVRNDAARPDGVSRLSAYLHYGQISPFRIARQVYCLDGEGPDKYLDELITWREFAHHIGHCHRTRPGWDWLPNWAQTTLEDHGDDHRSALYDWETLARGQTDDRVWNLCQQSLLAHGELHNNLRMTWGKQLLHWTPTAQDAIAMAIDLNDRFALDGADPNSYLGILWCFGGFDRPFEPERDVIGRVRPRSTSGHARRLDLKIYRQWVHRPALDPAPTVAIVGGGLAGLACGRTMADHGLSPTIFDKGRGPGGRSSSRRTPQGLIFDHGAQYFTARQTFFRRYTKAWQEQGLVARWNPDLAVVDHRGWRRKDRDSTERFVGVPKMNRLCAHLGRDLDIRYDTAVEAVDTANADTWNLTLEGGKEVGPFDVVVLALPAPQTAHLLRTPAPALSRAAGAVEFAPTWALMIAFDEPLDLAFDAAFINDGPLAWIADNSSKPGRSTPDDSGQHWVVHATSEWSTNHLELPASTAAQQLEDALASLLEQCNTSLPNPTFRRAHRWRYARALFPLDDQFIQDPGAPGLIVCGDWLSGSRIEGAVTSGIATAARVIHGAVGRGRPLQPDLL